MIKHAKLFLISSALLALLVQPALSQAAPPAHSGKILLDVERRGEAWYVDPVSGKRVFLANGALAYEVMRDYGLGISDADLAKIPVGFIPVKKTETDILDDLEARFSKCDPASTSGADMLIESFRASGFKAMATPVRTTPAIELEPAFTGDALLCVSETLRDMVVSNEHLNIVGDLFKEMDRAFSDSDEDRIGYKDEKQIGTSFYEADTDGDGMEDGAEIEAGRSPLGEGFVKIDTELVNRLKGRIVLQTQGAGQAWYIHPISGRRYYMATGADAYRVMSYLGAGAPSKIIDAIPAEAESIAIHAAINRGGEPCDGFACYTEGIEADRETTSIITVESLDELRDAEADARFRILARFIPGAQKDYASFELIQVDAGVVKGSEVIDMLAGAEMMPEGMTTEQKAQLGQDIEVIYTHLMADIPAIAPRFHCVIPNRTEFLAQVKSVEMMLDLALSVTPDEEGLAALEEQIAAQESNFEGSTARCSVQMASGL